MTFNQRLVVDAPQTKKERANYFGAVESLDRKVIETVRKDSEIDSFTLLLKKVKKGYSEDKTLICMDNSRMHHSKKVSEFFRKQDNIKLLFLPPYSPNINPEEYMHNYLRNKLLNNQNFKSIKQIGQVIGRFTRKLDSKTIQSIATLIPIETFLSAQK